jgi:predicted RNase H-like HicB family nuclease
MRRLSYTVHLDPAEEGGYVVTVPALPGCMTQGDTFEEAMEMAADAIRCYLEGTLKLGKPIPIEESPRGPSVSRVVVEEPVTA